MQTMWQENVDYGVTFLWDSTLVFYKPLEQWHSKLPFYLDFMTLQGHFIFMAQSREVGKPEHLR